MIEVGLATIPSVIIGIVASYIASKIVFAFANINTWVKFSASLTN
jgi:hypothetical protein